ncbi:MAG: hypothetical protein K2X82_18775 [Gemmataceae bacterium]|nr:hypothetical protein [Gemmataceae bacterium]
MTETTWLSGADGEAMLDFVADRLTPRQWAFLAAAHVRRLWDLLPAGPFRDAVEAVELADQPLPPADRARWKQLVQDAAPAASAAAEAAQREVVRSADPDAADQDDPLLTRPNQIAPAFPLFRAASRHARTAIELAGAAVSEAADAVAGLLAEPGPGAFDMLRAAADQAGETRTRAATEANVALRLKHDGDELADRAAAAKNKRLEAARAEEIVRKVEESAGLGDADDGPEEEPGHGASARHLARVLREVVGNPFKPPRFEPDWRTPAVLELARGIHADRAWDRLPILADALLDADCDEEQVLRHLRGTEKGLKDPPQHARGCWAVELALGRWEPLPPPPKDPKPRRRLPDDFDLGLPRDDGTAFA